MGGEGEGVEIFRPDRVYKAVKYSNGRKDARRGSLEFHRGRQAVRERGPLVKGLIWGGGWRERGREEEGMRKGAISEHQYCNSP